MEGNNTHTTHPPTPHGLRAQFRHLVVLVVVLVWSLGACSATSSPPDGGAPDATVPTQGEFSLLTYNVHGLPSSITKDDSPGRQKLIGPLLNTFDVVGLQEVFTDEGYDNLMAPNQHTTRYRFAEVKEGRFMGSGLAFLAKYAATQEQHALFSACNGTLDGASDCLASKGFQMVRVALADGVEIDVYNSHFEAGSGTKDQEARATNLLELRKAMQTWSKDRPIVFLGDTNLHERKEADKPVLDAWLQEIGLKDACEAVGCPEKGRIDRVLTRSSAALSLTATKWWIPEGFVDAEGKELSDHDPIAVKLQWKRLP